MAHNLYDPIEGITSRSKENNPYDRYANLFELNEHLEEVESLEIDDIILSVSDKDRANYLARKTAHMNSRAFMHGVQKEASDQKASVYLEKNKIFLETLSVVCQFAAIPFGQVFSALGTAISSSSNYMEKMANSKLEILNHHSKRTDDIVNDHSKGLQTTEQGENSTSSMMDRMIQNSRRQAELVLGG